MWLEGGACVNLTVTSLEPELRHGLLQPMTQVEVLPPSENDGTCEFTPLNFTPALVVSPSTSQNTSDDSESDDKVLAKDISFSDEENEPIKCSSGKVPGIESSEENMYTLLLNYVCSKYRERNVYCEAGL